MFYTRTDDEDDDGLSPWLKPWDSGREPEIAIMLCAKFPYRPTLVGRPGSLKKRGLNKIMIIVELLFCPRTQPNGEVLP